MIGPMSIPPSKCLPSPALRRRLFCLACSAMTIVVTFLLPVIAFAQRRGEEEGSELKEARLEGYAANVKAAEGGPALTYLLLIFLAVLGLAVMFKNARRTHLD
jgi:hypothetical protein